MRTLLCVVAMFVTAMTVTAMFVTGGAFADDWRRLPSIPERKGVAGAFAGVSGGALLVAGGANFPNKKPWEGGEKAWSDAVFVLEKPEGDWKTAGKLPRQLGYGVSVTYRNAVVCVGGGDARRHYQDAFRLEWKDAALLTTRLPDLPVSIANACGALVGDRLYVAGGQKTPASTTTLKSAWTIDLAAKEPRWVEIDSWPGRGRMLAVAASIDGAFWLVGGVDLVAGKNGKAERKYLNDAYRYSPREGWTRAGDLPLALAAAPSPAPVDRSGFRILGGDGGSQIGAVPEKHRGFSKSVLRYDLQTQRWSSVGELPAARVTAPCVLWKDRWVVPSGEMRPGVRSAEVWAMSSEFSKTPIVSSCCTRVKMRKR